MARRYSDFVSVGPESLAGRYLRRFWQPVYASDRLAPGRPVPLRILDESFTLFRGESGRVGLVAPRCPHRGLVLSVGRVEGDCLSCLYHGWTFDVDGQCVDQPAEKRSFANTTRIAAYPVREYHGLIFAYFGQGAPPAFASFDLLEDEGTPLIKIQTRPFPFFNQLENTLDEVHFNFTHRVSQFTEVGLNEHIPELSCDETDYGIIRYGKRGEHVRTSHVIMPNCTLTSVPRGKGWADRIAWRVPVDSTSHLSVSIDFVYLTGADAEELKQTLKRDQQGLAGLEPMDVVVDKILSGTMHIDDIGARPDIVLLQDTVAMRGQGAVNRENDSLGASDRHVKLFRDIWTRELRNLETNRLMKAWRSQSNLRSSRGV